MSKDVISPRVIAYPSTEDLPDEKVKEFSEQLIRSIKEAVSKIHRDMEDLASQYVPNLVQGDILYVNATELVRLAAGTSGYFLKTLGAAADPAWAAVAGGGTPALTLGTTNAAGSAATHIRTDDTILVFDSTVPTTIAYGDAAAAGSGAIAAYRNHTHGMAAHGTAQHGEGDLGAASVDQATLKTTLTTTAFSSATHTVVTGGTYQFIHQQKKSASGGQWITGGCVGSGNHNVANSFLSTAYQGGWAGADPSGVTYTAQARYVTASGRDFWMFLKVAKIAFDEVMGGGFVRRHPKGDILVATEAPDHCSYGTGLTEEEMPHPFGELDPALHEVVLVDNVEVEQMRKRVTRNRGLLDILREEYEPDMASKPTYTPREIIEIDEYGDRPGEMIREMPTPEWARLMITADRIQLKRRMVMTLPRVIKYRRLKRKGG